MATTLFYALIGLSLIVGYGANRFFQHTRIPDVIVLIATGVLLGPVFRLVHVATYRDEIAVFGTLALILVLFEGGLRVRAEDLRPVIAGSVLFALVSFSLTSYLLALLFRHFYGLSDSGATLVGAALACNSSAIVLPVIRQVMLPDRARLVVLFESLTANILAVLTVGILIRVGQTGATILDDLALGFLLKTSISLLLAVLVGELWSRALPRLSEQRFWHVVTLGVVLSVYATSRAIGGSGLLAVFIFGAWVANRRLNAPGTDAFLHADRHIEAVGFHSELGFLVRSVFFVMLGMVAQFAWINPWFLGLAVLIFMATRWIGIQVSRPLLPGLHPSDRVKILWMVPRGLVSAVLCIQIIDAKGEAFGFLFAVSFAVIVVSNLVLVMGVSRMKPA